MAAVADGRPGQVDGGDVRARGEVVATGTVLDAAEHRGGRWSRPAAASATSSSASPRTPSSTCARRRSSTFDAAAASRRCSVDFKGRHALVVVRGHDYREDLRAPARGYIREFRPVLIGVDGGADALLEMGLQARRDHRRLRLGVRAGAALGRRPRAPRAPRRPGARARELARRWASTYQEFVVEGTSEDVAMLLAYEAGAELIVAVGTHATMVEFLDKGRAGMASTFLTRLRLGPMLVDAKGVSRLYEGRVRTARPRCCSSAPRWSPCSSWSLTLRPAPDLLRRASGSTSATSGSRSPAEPMINFRFHLVSLVAVFLALAIGVVVGSTSSTGPSSTASSRSVDSVERPPRRQQDENDELRDELERAAELRRRARRRRVVDAPSTAAPWPWWPSAASSRGRGRADRRACSSRPGATAPGILWLEPSWALDRGRATGCGLAEALDVPGDRRRAASAGPPPGAGS